MSRGTGWEWKTVSIAVAMRNHPELEKELRKEQEYWLKRMEEETSQKVYRDEKNLGPTSNHT